MSYRKLFLNRIDLFAVLAVLSLPILFSSSCSVKASDNGEEAKIVETFYAELFLVEESTITRSYTASAILEGSEEAIVATSVSGTIKEFYVKEGAIVKKGEKMALLDQEDFKLEVRKAGAMAKVKRQSYERKKKLFKKGALSSSEYEAAGTDLEIADATHSQAKLSLERTVVKSPISGQVALKSSVIGQRVVPGTTFFKIINTDNIKMTVALSEKEVIHLTKGDAVEVNVDAWPGETFMGRIESVRVSPDSATASFPVDVNLAGDDRLMPGMVARVTMSGEVFSGLLLVPSESFAEKGGAQYVFVFKDGVARLRKVSRGRRFGEYVEVVSGLEAGEEIIPVYGSELADGSPVNPANRVKKGEPVPMLQGDLDDVDESEEAFDG
jgi:membrane fusion protein (multidrug efflux system)